MPKFISQVVQKCDIFGNGIGLNMNQQNIYKTKFGGFISIVVGIIISYYFWTNFIIFINQEKMTVTSEMDYDVNPSTIQLGKNSMMFAINIYQTNLDFVQSPYFNIVLNIGQSLDFKQKSKKDFFSDLLIVKKYNLCSQISQYYQGIIFNYSNKRVFENKGSTFNYNYLPVELEPCTEAHFESYFNAKFVSENIKTDKQNIVTNFVCPKLGQQFDLSGLYLSPVFNFLRIQVKKCNQSELESVNPNWKVKCAPSDAVDQFLQKNANFRVSVYHNNFLISPDKNTDYAQAYLNQDLSFLFVPNQMFKSVDVFFRDYKIKTNNYGFLTSKTSYDQYIVYDYKDYNESTTLGQQGDVFTEVFFRRSPYTQIYRRDHENFTQFLSGLGGFINILITVIGIFIRKYNYFQFTIDLANKLYNFQFQILKKKSDSISKDQLESKNSNTLQILPQQEIVKQSPIQFVQQKANNQGYEINYTYNVMNCQDSPSKLSRKSSKIVTEDIFNQQESPQININQIPSQLEITKPSVMQNPKGSEQKEDNNNQSNNKMQNIIPIQIASFNKIIKNETNKKSNINIIRQKMWKIVKFINSKKYQQLQIVQKKEKQNTQSSNKLREQIQNYKQLGYSNKTDFLFSYFKKLIKQQQQKINYGFIYLLRAFKCNHHQNTILMKAQNSVSLDLDIYTILQKLQEVEKIKRIIFNKDQNTLFSFCPKPLIRYADLPPEQKSTEQNTNISNPPLYQDTNNQQNDHLLINNNDFEQIESYQKLYQAFDKIRKKDNKDGMNVINRRLIKELGDEINEIFELSREVAKEGDEKQAQLESSMNISKKRETINQSNFKPTFTRTRNLSKYSQPPQQYIHLNSLFNSNNQLKTKEEPASQLMRESQKLDKQLDDQYIYDKTLNNDISINKLSVQQTANISFFELENKSQNFNFDTIPDIPFEPEPESNINKQEFQKETKLKQII